MREIWKKGYVPEVALQCLPPSREEGEVQGEQGQGGAGKKIWAEEEQRDQGVTLGQSETECSWQGREGGLAGADNVP